MIADFIKEIEHLTPTILVLNKIDLLSSTQIQDRQRSYLELYPEAAPLQLSAVKGTGQQDFLAEIINRLPPSPPLYSPDQITDFYEREIAADLIREAALLHLRDEIPTRLLSESMISKSGGKEQLYRGNPVC